jgi:hypothetical protein
MKSGDKVEMRVDGGRWLLATVVMLTKTGRPGLVRVAEGIPAPFTLCLGQQAVAVTWTGDVAGDLFVPGRRIEFREPAP